MTEKSKEKMINVAALSAHFKEAVKSHFDKMLFDNEHILLDKEYDKNIAVKRDTIFDTIKFQHLMEKIRQDTIKNGPQMPMVTRIIPKFKEDDENVEYQVVKEPTRKVFSVDVGDMKQDSVEKYLDQVKAELQAKRIERVAQTKPYDAISTMEDYVNDQGFRDHIKNVKECMTPAKIAEKILSTPVQLGKNLPKVHDAGYYYAPYIPKIFADDVLAANNLSKEELIDNMEKGITTPEEYKQVFGKNADRKWTTTYYDDNTVSTTYEPFKINMTTKTTNASTAFCIGTGNLSGFNNQGKITTFTAIAGTCNATAACNSIYFNTNANTNSVSTGTTSFFGTVNSTACAANIGLNATIASNLFNNNPITPKPQVAGNPYGYYTTASTGSNVQYLPDEKSSYFYYTASGKESIYVTLDDGVLYNAFIEPQFDELTSKHNFQIQKLLRLVQQSQLTTAEAYMFMKDNWIQQHFKITTI